MPTFHYVYVLICADGSLYVGQSRHVRACVRVVQIVGIMIARHRPRTGSTQIP
jgi:hypothetical protein